MAQGRPVEAETRETIVNLINAGNHSRNQIAREAGVAGSTVTAIAREIGHVFDRSQSELAVAARQIDLSVMRSELARAAMVEAWQALEDMHAPTIMVHYQGLTESGDGGVFMEHTLDEPLIGDRRNLATVFGILVQRSTDLARVNEGGNVEDGVSVLGGLRDALRGAADALADVDPTVIPRDDGSTTEKDG